MSSEWNIIDPMIPVRQGDLLVSRDPSIEGSAEYFLVITADCDINNEKFGKQLACLRVIPLNEYYKTIWAERLMKTAEENADKKVLAQVNKWYSQKRGAETKLSKIGLIHWMKKQTSEAIAEALDVETKKRKKFCKSLENYKVAQEIMTETHESVLVKYVEFFATVEGQPLETAWKSTLKKTSSGLPDDVFLLSSIPSDGQGAAVILLRELVGIAFDRIYCRSRDAVSKDDYLRVSRLEAVFKYAVSQSFGSLYSRIGLPNDYVQKNKEILALIKDEWVY